MSLMLRKYCQNTLTNVGLADYHVGMSESKHMVIAGECGRPLLTVAGITFPKLAPTKVEIEYADVLLIEFLRTHKPEIDKYLKLHNRFLALPVPAQETDDFYIKIGTSGYPMVTKVIMNYSDGCINYAINNIDSEPLESHPISVHPGSSVKDIEANTVTLDTHAAAMKHFKRFLAWKKLEKELNDMRELLSACDI